MKSIVAFRPLRSGVSVDDWRRAVLNGTRESVLGNPAPMPVAVYDQLRALERELGKRGVDPAGPEAEEFRQKLSEWQRGWDTAEPCDRDGNPLAEAEAPPLSPLERRQFRPRRKAGGPRVDADRERREPAFQPARDARRGPPGGAVRVPWHLRKLVRCSDGAEWWRLQCLGLGRSPAARAAYAAALRQLNTPAEKAGKMDGDKAEP